MHALVHPLDLSIFAFFLLVTLIVGLSHGRQVKTLQDYALGGKNFSTVTLVATIVATWITGSFLAFRIGNMYENGLYAIILYLCDVGALVLTGWILAIRMVPFLQNISIAEAMGNIYGKPVRTVAAIFGLLVSIGLVTIQFKAGEKLFSILFGWDSTRTQIAVGSIIIVYSTLGGIRAVTFTDVLQFFTFGTLIPILTFVVWKNTYDSDSVLHMFQTVPDFNIGALISTVSEKKWKFLSLIPLYLVPALTPPIFQRATMAKNVYQVRRAFLCSALICFCLLLLIVWIAILIRAEDGSLAPSYVFQHIIENHTSRGIMGLLLAGLMAMIMSTADSNLNAASVIFANDLIGPITASRKYPGLKLLQSDKNRLIIARAGSAVLGILALLLALHSDSYLYTKLVLGVWGYYMPVVSVPIILAILGFRSTTKAALIGMAAGFTIVYLWDDYLYSYTVIDSNIPGMAANLIALLGTHYLLGEPGGWQKVAPDSPLGLKRAARRKAWQRCIKAIKKFRPYPYLQQNLPQQKGIYFLFGLYAFFAFYVVLYVIDPADLKVYYAMYKGILHVGLLANTAFLTFPIWLSSSYGQRFITFFWPLGIATLLFFAGTLLVIITHFHPILMMVLLLNCLVTVLLLRWPLALIMALGGVSLAVLFFKQYTGEALPWNELGASPFRLLNGLLLFVSLLIVLFKGKQAYKKLGRRNDSLATANQTTKETLLASFKEKAQLVNVLRQAGVSNLSRIAQMIRELRTKDHEVLGGASPLADTLQQLTELVTPMAVTLERIENRATDYLCLDVDTVAIDKLLDEVRAQLDTHGIHEEDVLFEVRTRHRTLTCDPARIKTLLVNGIAALQKAANDKGVILVGLEDTQLAYKLSSVQKDYTKRIAAIRLSMTTKTSLPSLEEQYPAQIGSTSLSVPETAQELPLAINHKVVKSHYGFTNVKTQNDTSTLLYVIPAQLREARPKDMDRPYMELGAKLIRANDAYPGAVEQEEAFLAAVQQKTTANLALVEMALEAIKWYHGPVKRKSGEPFYLHPVAVAQIVLAYNQDEATVLGALLHDTVEDTPMLLESIETMFGKEVAAIVDGVTHLESNKKSFYRVQLTPHENILMLLETKEKRVLYVKIADRMHNMRTIHAKPYESQQKTADETLRFFVPLAKLLGLEEAAEELKKRSMEVLNKDIK